MAWKGGKVPQGDDMVVLNLSNVTMYPLKCITELELLDSSVTSVFAWKGSTGAD